MSCPAILILDQGSPLLTKPLQKAPRFEKELEELYSHTDKTSAYQLTLPLLAASELKEEGLYRASLSTFNSLLGLSETMTAEEFKEKVRGWGAQATRNFWLMGRIVVAADVIGDRATAERVSALMRAGFEENTAIDPYSSWAWGYLTIHDSSQTGNLLAAIETLKAQKGEKEQDNVQWAIVMALLAAASAKDEKSYYALLENLKEWTGKATVEDALLTIPPGDFTAWALSIALLSAAKIGDKTGVKELSEPTQKAIANSTSEGDRLLANLNVAKSNPIIE